VKGLKYYHKLFLVLILLVIVAIVYAYMTRSQAAIYLLCLSVLVLGGLGMVYSMRLMCESIKSYRWIPKEYKVVNATVAFVSSPKGRGALNTFEPFFEVEYEFDNKVYRRALHKLNLHLVRYFATLHDANDYLEKIKSGLYGNKVYVNPDSPEKAFIRRGISRDQIGIFLFSCILFVMSLLTFFDVVEWR